MALAIEDAFIGTALANHRPAVARQIHVRCQRRANRGLATIDRLGKPGQLRAGTNLIHAALVALGLGNRHAVPGIFRRLLQRHPLGHHVFLVRRIGGAEGKAAVGHNIAGLLNLVVVNAVIQVSEQSVLHGQLAAVGVGQHQGRALQCVTVIILRHQAHIIKHLAADRRGYIRQMADVEIHSHRVEIGSHAGIRHAVQVCKRVRRSIHGAEDIAVGERILCRLRAIGKFQILRNGDGNGAVIHPLILTQLAAVLLLAGRIAQIERGGVENTGNLVDCTIQAVEGQRGLIARHQRFAGVGGVRHGHGHLRRTNQAIGHAGFVGHAQNHRAAQPIAQGTQFPQAHRIATILSGHGPPIGHRYLHIVARGHQGIRHLHFAGGRDAKVQHRVLVRLIVEPGVIVVVPVHRAGGHRAHCHMEVHIGIRRAAGLIGHHHHAGTLRVGGREQAAMAAVVFGGNMNGIIVDRQNGGAVGGDIRPVFPGVAAIHRCNRGIAGQHRPVEIRLQHDIAGIGIDDLPVAVHPHPLLLANHPITAGIQIDHQIRFVPGRDCRSQIAKIVQMCFLGRIFAEGEAEFLAVTAHRADPAGAGHLFAGGIPKPPGVVAVALADHVSIGLGTVLVVVAALRPIGRAALRLHLGGIEIIPLEVQAEGGILRHGGLQLHCRIDAHCTGGGGGAGLVGSVDILGKDVARDIRIAIQII